MGSDPPLINNGLGFNPEYAFSPSGLKPKTAKQYRYRDTVSHPQYIIFKLDRL